VTVRRAMIWSDNTADGRSNLSSPVMTLATSDKAGREILLALFGDGSALVLRALMCGTSPYAQSMDEFSVLPIVLRLGSVIKPLAGGSEMIVQPRRETGPNLLELGVALRSRPQHWVNISASIPASPGVVDDQSRQELLENILKETRAYACYLDQMPIMKRCYAGEAFEGPLTKKEIDRLNQASPWKDRANSPTHYAVPAAIDYIAFTDEERRAYESFLIGIAVWMRDQMPELRRIDITVLTAQPSQAPLSRRKAQAQVNCKFVALGADPKDVDKRMTRILLDIMHSKLAPIPFDRLVGQELEAASNGRWLLSPFHIARIFTSDGTTLPSNHERLAAAKNFAPYWIEAE
jgi:hypothetical protein